MSWARGGAVSLEQHAGECGHAELGQEEREIGEGHVGPFLSLGRDGGGVLVEARRINRFADREDHDEEEDADVPGIYPSADAEIPVHDDASEPAVREALEMLRREDHDV